MGGGGGLRMLRRDSFATSHTVGSVQGCLQWSSNYVMSSSREPALFFRNVIVLSAGADAVPQRKYRIGLLVGLLNVPATY